MNYFFQLLIAIFSAIAGSLFTFFVAKHDSNKKLLIRQLNLVYMPLYREICFTPLNSDQKHLLSKMHDIVYKNFQYVPDDLFDLAIKLITASRSKDFDLWYTPEWNLFIKKVEIQYNNLQKLVNFDRKANNPDKNKRFIFILGNFFSYTPHILLLVLCFLSGVLFILASMLFKAGRISDQEMFIYQLIISVVAIITVIAFFSYFISSIRSNKDDNWKY
ncbi:hypothetical protein ACR75P_05075 [Faecalicoccus pleomorphus]|uniref:hypothetical protein n=1 Tax=Faecalicoccus pleomorphus TaxID=1323 RepID=UPI003DA624A9